MTEQSKTSPAWAEGGGSAQRKAELYASMLPVAWYAVCAEHERRARDELLDLNIEVWLPECRIAVSRRKKRTIIDGPLFPGYLFARGVLTDEWLACVLAPRSVNGVLRAGSGLPLRARDVEMDNLRRLVSEGGGLVLIEDGRVKRGYGAPVIEDCRFKPGEYLRVLDGPFAGFNAIFKQPAGNDRVKILVDIFGRSSEIELDEASVEAFA